MPGVFAYDPREAVMEDAAVQKTVNDLFDIRTQKAVPCCESLVIDLIERLKIILNTLIILGRLSPSGLVDRG